LNGIRVVSSATDHLFGFFYFSSSPFFPVSSPFSFLLLFLAPFDGSPFLPVIDHSQSPDPPFSDYCTYILSRKDVQKGFSPQPPLLTPDDSLGVFFFLVSFFQFHSRSRGEDSPDKPPLPSPFPLHDGTIPFFPFFPPPSCSQPSSFFFLLPPTTLTLVIFRTLQSRPCGSLLRCEKQSPPSPLPFPPSTSWPPVFFELSSGFTLPHISVVTSVPLPCPRRIHIMRFPPPPLLLSY